MDLLDWTLIGELGIARLMFNRCFCCILMHIWCLLDWSLAEVIVSSGSLSTTLQTGVEKEKGWRRGAVMSFCEQRLPFTLAVCQDVVVCYRKIQNMQHQHLWEDGIRWSEWARAVVGWQDNSADCLLLRCRTLHRCQTEAETSRSTRFDQAELSASRSRFTFPCSKQSLGKLRWLCSQLHNIGNLVQKIQISKTFFVLRNDAKINQSFISIHSFISI